MDKEQRKNTLRSNKKKRRHKKKTGCQPLHRGVISPISKRNRRVFVLSIHKAKKLVNRFFKKRCEKFELGVNGNSSLRANLRHQNSQSSYFPSFLGGWRAPLKKSTQNEFRRHKKMYVSKYSYVLIHDKDGNVVKEELAVVAIKNNKENKK